ncbi:MAG: hypothetical protein JW804_09070 [Sedimentisphaerales bacterium]|nr:hypothetical protein [Sedimentisphaerales bacterium]
MSEETKVTNNFGEDSLWTIIRDFYNWRMLPFIIIIWAFGIIIIAGAIWSGIEFYKSEEVKNQIMFAGIFICCVVLMNQIKIISWQFIHRNGLKRQIKKLHNQIAELSDIVKNK